jgi:hypothetical protein
MWLLGLLVAVTVVAAEAVVAAVATVSPAGLL